MTRTGDNRTRLMALYATMCRIRAFEETALAAHKAGEIPGPLHVSVGQEAVAVWARDKRLLHNNFLRTRAPMHLLRVRNPG